MIDVVSVVLFCVLSFVSGAGVMFALAVAIIYVWEYRYAQQERDHYVAHFTGGVEGDRNYFGEHYEDEDDWG